MKKKQTVTYFHDTFKLRDLSSVIRHWYELEELFGFQDPVSIPEQPNLQFTHNTQTPAGFPVAKYLMVM